MAKRATLTSEMKVLSLDAAFTRCEQLERSLRRVNGLRFALAGSFFTVLGGVLWSAGASAGVSPPPTPREVTWFVVFFGVYGTVVAVCDQRWRRRVESLRLELAEVRRWTEG